MAEVNAQPLIAPEAAEADFKFYPTANLAVEAGHDQWTPSTDADAEPVPELEFDKAFGWNSCASEMSRAAERGSA